MAGFVVVAVLGSAAIALAGFVSYLAFCAFVVKRTGGTSGLRDVAEAVRAFAAVGSLSPRSHLRSTAPPVELSLKTHDEAAQDGTPGAGSGPAA
jgi:hypothetical protein